MGIEKKFFAGVVFLLLAIEGHPVTQAVWWRLFFTRPCQWMSFSRAGTPESGLVSAIDGARHSFRGAFYEISSPRVVRALIAARARGVEVELVTERDNARKKKNRRIMERMEEAGVAVVTDTKRGLMHNKFAVIDGERLWTGSYNPTVNDSEKNNNNALLIESQDLCAIYDDEFTEMFGDRIFGNRRQPGPFALLRTRYHVRIGETDINVYFSPEDNVERIILKRLAKARASIHFMAFSFTSDPIGEMMIRKHREGVEVRGIFERRGSRGAHSEYTKMKLEGLPVKLDRNRHAMHHKVIVIDRARVITGSYNFSRNARLKNDENIIILDNREIAADYLKEFTRLYR